MKSWWGLGGVGRIWGVAGSSGSMDRERLGGLWGGEGFVGLERLSYPAKLPSSCPKCC